MSFALNARKWWECSGDELWAMNLRRRNFVAQDALARKCRNQDAAVGTKHNAGLSQSTRVAAKAIGKTPQSTWFDCCCTACTLSDIWLVSGRTMSHIWCKNTRGIFPLFRES